MKKTDYSFFLPYLVFLAWGLWLNIACTQKEIFFFVNRHYTEFLDIVMQPITYIGDGITPVIVGIIFILFLNFRTALAMLLGSAIEGILVHILKVYFFDNRPRPWANYVVTDAVHLVKNFQPFGNNSFPSGHTATAFFMVALLTLIWPKRRLGWLFLSIGLLVAFSRIYLSQHYFIDIYVGSILGTVTALGMYYLFCAPKTNLLKSVSWMDKNLLNLKR